MLLKPEEYLEKDQLPDMVWFHGLDILRYVLQGDSSQTFYKNDNSMHLNHLDELQREIAKHEGETEHFKEIEEELGEKRAKFNVFDDEEGEFNVDAFLNDEELVFEQEEKRHEQGKGYNLLIDMCIPFQHRRKKDMAKRHETVYNNVLEREAMGYPTRVLATFHVHTTEFTKPILFAVVIKDYEDPIFPGLWGALKTNKSTNSFINCIMSFFVGTKSPSNGSPTPFKVSNFLDEEFTIVEPRTTFISE